ncbi:MAG TPA: NAD(+) diphosphatase [Burkholderiaceae bacterium]
MALPDAAVCLQAGADPAHFHAVGELEGVYCRTAWLDAEPALLPDGWVLLGLRALFERMDDALLGVAARACQIAEWARTHRYCGACGGPMTALAGERCYQCEPCGLRAYPRISPAMMVLIRRGDDLLLARHTLSPTGRYSPLAGFLEAGESIEEAVHREVYEEVGLKVDNLRYFASQTWPFPHSLMIAFTADYVSGEIVTDAAEIADARWFTPAEAREQYVPTVSISSQLVAAALNAA